MAVMGTRGSILSSTSIAISAAIGSPKGRRRSRCARLERTFLGLLGPRRGSWRLRITEKRSSELFGDSVVFPATGHFQLLTLFTTHKQRTPLIIQHNVTIPTLYDSSSRRGNRTHSKVVLYTRHVLSSQPTNDHQSQPMHRPSTKHLYLLPGLFRIPLPLRSVRLPPRVWIQVLRRVPRRARQAQRRRPGMDGRCYALSPEKACSAGHWNVQHHDLRGAGRLCVFDSSAVLCR